MNVLKASSTFLFFSIVLSACFDPEPSFPDTPYIKSVSLVFVEGKDFYSDSLNLTIHYQDGDGDLGFTDPPYNYLNFFLVNNGELEKVETIKRYNDLPPFINPSVGQKGKLATVRTRKEQEFESLPPYTIPYSCINYIYDSVYISEEHKDIFDGTYNVSKTLTHPNYPKVYVLLDTFYYEVNPHYFNIKVDFLVKQNDNSFKEFDWTTEFCVVDNNPGVSYNGLFPKKSEKEGKIYYPMVSYGFKLLFSGETLKLRVQIFDRALNASNVIETTEITL